MEQSFNFMGEVLSVSKGRDQYTYVRKKYHNLAKNLQQEFIEKFESYDDMDELHEYGLSDGYNLIMKAVDRSLDLLVNNDIIDINRNLFLGIYEKYCNWESVFGKIDDQYMEIVLDEEQKAAYRQARKENRMRFSGGGFGISGALKGTAKAEALNLATGAIYGAANLVGKGISMIGTSMKKSNLFNDPQTKMTLHLGIYWNIFRMHYALIDILRKKKRMDFDVPSDDDESSVKAIIDNLPKIQGDKTDYIIQALNLYPYNYELYKYVLENMDDNDAEIAPIADYFGVSIADFVQEKIEKIVSKFNLEDEDSLIECKNVVEHTMELYLLTSSPTIELLEHKLAEIDIAKRTFKGFLYETRELREKAVEQDAEIRALCDNVADEYQALLELKTKIINTEYLGNVKDEYIASLTRRAFEHEKAELVNNYNMVDKNDLEAINNLRIKIEQSGYDEDLQSKFVKLLSIDAEMLLTERKYINIDKTDKAQLYLFIHDVKNNVVSGNVINRYIDKVNSDLDHIAQKEQEPIKPLLIEYVRLAEEKGQSSFYSYCKVDAEKMGNFIEVCQDRISKAITMRNILAYYDKTLLGSGNEGIALTLEGIYFVREKGDLYRFYPYSSIEGEVKYDSGLLSNNIILSCGGEKIKYNLGNSATGEVRRSFTQLISLLRNNQAIVTFKDESAVNDLMKDNTLFEKVADDSIPEPSFDSKETSCGTETSKSPSQSLETMHDENKDVATSMVTSGSEIPKIGNTDGLCTYKITLMDCGTLSKIGAIKALRTVLHISFPDAKSLVDKAPSVLVPNCSFDEMTKLRQELNDAGLTVDISKNW